MDDRCAMELCPNWSGDGDVCSCTLLDLPRPTWCDLCQESIPAGADWHEGIHDSGEEVTHG